MWDAKNWAFQNFHGINVVTRRKGFGSDRVEIGMGTIFVLERDQFTEEMDLVK